jgi:hypothetical protein
MLAASSITLFDNSNNSRLNRNIAPYEETGPDAYPLLAWFDRLYKIIDAPLGRMLLCYGMFQKYPTNMKKLGLLRSSSEEVS